MNEQMTYLILVLILFVYVVVTSETRRKYRSLKQELQQLKDEVTLLKKGDKKHE